MSSMWSEVTSFGLFLSKSYPPTSSFPASLSQFPLLNIFTDKIFHVFRGGEIQVVDVGHKEQFSDIHGPSYMGEFIEISLLLLLTPKYLSLITCLIIKSFKQRA